MNVERMLTRLSNDGTVIVRWGELPKEANYVKKWAVNTLCFGQVGLSIGDNLKETVRAAYEDVYSKEDTS